MAVLLDGLNSFPVPYGKAFLRVVKGVPVIAELDVILPKDQVKSAIEAAFPITVSLGVVSERVRLPIQLYRRATNTIDRIVAKMVVYEILYFTENP